MLLEDAMDLAAIYAATGRTVPAGGWVASLKALAAEAGIDAMAP